MQMYRQTWAEVDLDAIHANVSAFVEHVKGEQEVLVAVKADGYGHGAVPVAQEALRAGAAWLGVALLEEALELRQAGIEAPILLMGYLDPEHMPLAQKHRISVTLTDGNHLQRVLPVLDHTFPPLHFHLKVDTGMGRLGIADLAELRQVILDYEKQKLNGTYPLRWEGIYTHLATADEADQTYLQQQMTNLEQMLKALEEQGMEIPYRHMSNSAGTMRRLRRPCTNLVRVGISIYGLAPSPYMKDHLPFMLRPAFSLHSRLSFVKKPVQNRGISYGVTYRTKGEEWIGTLPIGYADGLSRPLSNRAQVLIRGKKMDIVGHICMDQTMVKMDQAYPIGEKVTLIGSQGEAEISADDLARLLGTVNYEIPCQITKRVPRFYTRSGTFLATD